MKKKITIISISIMAAIILLVLALIIFSQPKQTTPTGDNSVVESTVESTIPQNPQPQGVTWANKIWANKRDVSAIQDITIGPGVGSNISWKYGDVSIDLVDTHLFIYTDTKIPVASAENMFADLTNLTAINGIEYFDFSNCKNFKGMFANCNNLEILDLSANTFDKAENMSQMFYGCECLKTFKINNIILNHVTDMSQMFEECVMLESLQLPETPQVTTAQRMFKGVGYATSTGCVVNGTMSFPKCDNFTEMFLGSQFTSLDFANDFDMTNAVTTERMFCDATCPEDIDFSNWTTPNLQNTYEMFAGASNVKNITLDNWDCSNLVSCERMFYLTTAHDISLKWKNVKKLENVDSMFNASMSLKTIDLSGFNGIHVKSANQIFMDGYWLEKIYCNGFTADSGTEAFWKCDLLKGAIAFDNTKIDINMANTNGYFTAVD